MAKDNTTIIELDPQKAGREFSDIVARCYKNNPAKEDIKALKDWLGRYPELYKTVFDLSEVVKHKTIDGFVSDQDGTSKAFVLAQIKVIQNDLGYERAPGLEKLLIQNITLAWLRYLYAEYQLSTRMQSDSTYINAEHWEKRTNAAHRRYMRAVETLARVRKLTANIQINIAADGGQQVNIGGDLNK